MVTTIFEEKNNRLFLLKKMRNIYARSFLYEDFSFVTIDYENSIYKKRQLYSIVHIDFKNVHRLLFNKK